MLHIFLFFFSFLEGAAVVNFDLDVMPVTFKSLLMIMHYRSFIEAFVSWFALWHHYYQQHSFILWGFYIVWSLIMSSWIWPWKFAPASHQVWFSTHNWILLFTRLVWDPCNLSIYPISHNIEILHYGFETHLSD